MFRFDPVRSSQAASVIAEYHPSPISNSRILSLLYLADRQSIAETGYPITGDTLVSTGTGPALQNLPILLEDPEFHRIHISPVRPHVNHPAEINNCNWSELSPHAVDTLRNVCDRYAGSSDIEFAEHFRSLP